MVKNGLAKLFVMHSGAVQTNCECAHVSLVSHVCHEPHLRYARVRLRQHQSMQLLHIYIIYIYIYTHTISAILRR